VHPKSTEDTEKLVKLFTNSFLTKNLETKERKTLADAMFVKKFAAGESIIRYGDIGAEYFVLFKGSVRVTVYQPGANPFDPKLSEKISFQKELHANPDVDPSIGMIGFGEIALLYNDKRTAAITAITECETWVLTGECFKYIIAQNSIRRRNISLDFLNKVEMLKELEQYEKVKLIDGLTTL
jgi:cAMP-dependent protein kinase regulator